TVGPEKDGQDGQRTGQERDGARMVVLADRVERAPARVALHRPPGGEDPESNGQEEADVADRLSKRMTRDIVTGLRSQIPVTALLRPRSSLSGHRTPPAV